MSFIDVHCHINNGDYGDVDALMRNIRAAGVSKIISAGFDLPSSLCGKELSERYDGVYFTAGFHPTELKGYKEGDLGRIEALSAHKKCVAIGEIGLDYHYPDTDKPKQTEIFLRQLEMAERLNLPVQIHSRDSAEDMLSILKIFAPRLKGGVMLHCYSHSAEIAAELEKLGCFFSFGGTVTYSGSKRARRAVAALDISRIMTETDSPYLPPKSMQGAFPNTPVSIPEVAGVLAEIKGTDPETLRSAVWETAHGLFKKLENIR